MAGTLTISTLSDGTNSTSATNCISGSAKAWVNFNGTGTPAIRASYNVSSVTKVSTGIYTVTFTNAMTDANYGVNTTSGDADGNRITTFYWYPNQTTTSIRVYSTYSHTASVFYDTPSYTVSIFR